MTRVVPLAQAAPHVAMPDGWIEALPGARGRMTRDADLGAVTWFRVGGPADLLFKPADAEDLAMILAALPRIVPVTVLGVGSNLLVRDGGIPGLTIRLGRGFAGIEVDHRAAESPVINAGAGALDLTVASAARDAGVDDLAFLSGVPGTIGGALRMNAGAYGTEMRDVTLSALAMDRDGARHDLPLQSLGFTYRHCGVDPDWIFLSARLRGRTGDPATIAARMEEIRVAREDSQPTRARTGGSTFANPDGRKAWELIDAVGGRGLRVGGAMVSEKHCNFLINTGDASARDIETLGETLRQRVRDQFDVTLRWEIRRVGVESRQ